MARARTEGPAGDPAEGDAPVVIQQSDAEQAVTETASEDVARAAEKRRAAAVGDPEWRRQNDIDALLAERRGYVTRGMEDRAALVDEQLARLGADVPKGE